MRINRITIDNFQGIKHLEINPNGQNMTVIGDNATGKTTIANAITWLFSGKPLDGSKNYNPKPRDADGGEIHFIEPTVEIEAESGEQVTLKKALTEVWSKTKGSPDKIYKGNQNTFAINGVPVTAGEYQERIDKICPPEMLQILTSPFYFAEMMPWQDRRRLLMDTFAQINDSDVLKKEELKDLVPLLEIQGSSGGVYSVDELLAIKKAELKRINGKLKDIPVRIDEASRAMPDVKGLTKKAVSETIKELRKQSSDLATQRAGLTANTMIAALEVEKNKLIMERARKKMEFDAAESAKQKVKIDERKKIQEAITVLERAIASNEAQADRHKTNHDNLSRKREELMCEYKTVRESVFEFDTICPTCGQKIPEEKINEARENWNLQKSQRLEAINQKGKLECNKKDIEHLQEMIQKIEDDNARKRQEIDQKKQEIESIIVPDAVDFEMNTEAIEIKEKIEAIDKQIASGSVDTASEDKRISEAITEIAEKIAEEEGKLHQIDIAKTQKARIRDLKDEEKELAASYEAAEKAVHLCEVFIQEKARMLTDSINGYFNKIQFKLFDTQINGGIKECCEVMVKSKEGLVPFHLANNAGRINSGIEFIEVFSKHENQRMPLIIDNIESVTRLAHTDSQLIELKVDEKCKELDFQFSI